MICFGMTPEVQVTKQTMTAKEIINKTKSKQQNERKHLQSYVQ
jgi:hypothetical protein